MVKITNFIVTAFVTVGTVYEEILATHLLPSLTKLNLDYHIESVESKGSWLANVALKPKTILEALEKYPSKNIVCLDADSEVLHYPELFHDIPEDYDIACHHLNWNVWYGYTHSEPVKELLTGTMWFKNTEKVKNVIREWAAKAETTHMWEQKVLADVLKRHEEIKIYPLPIEYCYILTLPSGKPPILQVDKPIIAHHQVSRKYKRKMR